MEEKIIQVTPENFTQKLRELRQEKALTQDELAEKSGVSQKSISAMENGKMHPSLKMILAILAVLGVGLLIKAAIDHNGGETNA